MKRKALAVIMAAAMVFGLAGCGQDGADSKESSSGSGADQAASESGEEAGEEASGEESSSEAEDAEDESQAPEIDLSEHYDISIWRYKEDFKYYDNLSEQPVAWYLNREYNISLNYEHPATGNEISDLNLMMSTGDYTDVVEMSYSQDGSASLYEDGVIYDLAPYIDQYMPNLKMRMEANAEFAKGMHDAEGHIFTLPVNQTVEPNNMWGGLVYRRDILETMTGGNVAFPSGNDQPTTVEDWDYMLELMKQYFESSGLPDYACLIIPAKGYFDTGELLSGFGTTGTYMVVDDTVYFGPYTDNFYNYLSKMHEWYEKGYVYQDFASRTNDIFYLPNTALTYGGAAGVFYGTQGCSGDRMSNPEYGLNVLVEPCSAPVDTEHLEKGYGIYSYTDGTSINQGWAVTKACEEDKLIRFLTAMDWLYSDYGSLVRSYGLTEKEGAAENPYYQELGLTEGAWHYDEDGNIVPNDLTNEEMIEAGEVEDLSISIWNLAGNQLPGMRRNDIEFPKGTDTLLNEHESEVWASCGHENVFPIGAYLTAQESQEHTSRMTTISDYVGTMAVKFITGSEKLDETSWAKYKEQLKAYGVEDNIAIYQTAYDRFNQ